MSINVLCPSAASCSSTRPTSSSSPASCVVGTSHVFSALYTFDARAFYRPALPASPSSLACHTRSTDNSSYATGSQKVRLLSFPPRLIHFSVILQRPVLLKLKNGHAKRVPVFKLWPGRMPSTGVEPAITCASTRMYDYPSPCSQRRPREPVDMSVLRSRARRFRTALLTTSLIYLW